MDLELHAHNMRLLFEAGYGNAACALAEQFGAGGIAERLLAALEQRSEVDTLRAQLAAANAQRDEARAVVNRVCELIDGSDGGVMASAADVWNYCTKKLTEWAIARAQSGQPAQRDDDGTASGGGAQ
jgi:hypothetical protein